MNGQSFTLDNGVTVSPGYANKGVYIEAPRFCMFITQERLAALAQREYDDLSAIDNARRESQR